MPLGLPLQIGDEFLAERAVGADDLGRRPDVRDGDWKLDHPDRRAMPRHAAWGGDRRIEDAGAALLDHLGVLAKPAAGKRPHLDLTVRA